MATLQENSQLSDMEIDFASEWNEEDSVCEDAESAVDEESCKFVCGSVIYRPSLASSPIDIPSRGVWPNGVMLALPKFGLSLASLSSWESRDCLALAITGVETAS